MKRLMLLGLFLSFSHGCLAASPLYGWYVGGSVGGTRPIISHTTIVNNDFGWPSDQYRNHHVGTNAQLGIQSGYTWATCHCWFPSYTLGASYTYVFPTEINGRLRQFSLPEFENYNFRYKVQRQTFLALFKVDIYRWCRMMPFVTLGAGFSLNRSESYSERALANVTPRLSPHFGSKVNAAPSYIIGAGFDFIANKNFLLSLEYNYGYFGHARTRHGDEDFAQQKLATKLNANTILLSANYYIGC